MSIPYNDNLSLTVYQSNPNWHKDLTADLTKADSQGWRAVGELGSHSFNQPIARSVQFIRDTARLVIKVSYRALRTPIFLEKNWQERERAKVNAKLTGYAFVQLVSVPVKFLVALVALCISTRSQDKAQLLLDTSETWTMNIDGRTSKLEALKEEGAKKLQNRDEYNQYKAWLNNIDPKLCSKTSHTQVNAATSG